MTDHGHSIISKITSIKKVKKIRNVAMTRYFHGLTLATALDDKNNENSDSSNN